MTNSEVVLALMAAEAIVRMYAGGAPLLEALFVVAEQVECDPEQVPPMVAESADLLLAMIDAALQERLAEVH